MKMALVKGTLTDDDNDEARSVRIGRKTYKCFRGYNKNWIYIEHPTNENSHWSVDTHGKTQGWDVTTLTWTTRGWRIRLLGKSPTSRLAIKIARRYLETA